MANSTTTGNPKRDSVYTNYGSVMLERTAPQQYRVFMDDVEIGTVGAKKRNRWQCGDSPDHHPDRITAIKATIVQWSKKRLTPPVN